MSHEMRAAKQPHRKLNQLRLWQNQKVEHALMLASFENFAAQIAVFRQTGSLPAEAAERIVQAIENVRGQLAAGTLQPNRSATEACLYSVAASQLKEELGSIAEELFALTDEQLATDIRLWLRVPVIELAELLITVRRQLVALVSRDQDVLMPGYAHMQPTRPISLAQWWLANEARLGRDLHRLLDCFDHINKLPMWSVVPQHELISHDPILLARQLGMDGCIQNSVDALSDRDYIVELATFATLVGLHLSQMATDLLLWSTREYGFIRLPRNMQFNQQPVTTRRSTELLEILRAAPASCLAQLVESVSQLKGVPLSFSQDLQESLSGTLEMIDNLKFTLELTSVLLSAMEFDVSRMRELAARDLSNQSSAVDFLVDRGIPSDKAAKVVDLLLTYCMQRNKQLLDLTLNEWLQFSPAFDEQVYSFLNQNGEEHETTFSNVVEQINDASSLLERDITRVRNLSSKRLNCPEPGERTG